MLEFGFYNMDCMQGMKEFPDKYFDLAIVDPPYREKNQPTQKPVALYKWILKNYAKAGDKILDTHVGSASSLIACYDMGFEYVGFEIDPEYYKQASERLEAVKAQIRFDL